MNSKKIFPVPDILSIGRIEIAFAEGEIIDRIQQVGLTHSVVADLGVIKSEVPGTHLDSPPSVLTEPTSGNVETVPLRSQSRSTTRVGRKVSSDDSP